MEETKMEDLIRRQDAIDVVKKNTFRLTFAEEQNCEGHVAWSAEAVYSDVMEGALLDLPSANPDLSGYSDRLWKRAYDRGYERCKDDAIEAICREGTRLERNGTVAMVEIKQWCVDLLEELPFAQPEHLVKESSDLVKDLVNDCISRQALYEILDEYDEGKIYWGEAEDRIGNLQSVKSEKSTTAEKSQLREEKSTCDLITRRKAFEYFVTLWECIGTIMDRDEWEDVCMTTANEIPSAQPEIIRCKDCKNYYFADNRVPSEQSWVCDAWGVDQTAHMGYCFKAERRTDEIN